MAHKKKSKSLIQRLFTFNLRPGGDAIICQPAAGEKGPFFRFRKEGGILVPISNFPFDTFNSCMGIPEDDGIASANEPGDEMPM